MRRVDRLLKVVSTFRIRRALRIQGRGDPSGDNAQVSELRAARHLLALLGLGLDEAVPSSAAFRKAVDLYDGSVEADRVIHAMAELRGTDDQVNILSTAFKERLQPVLFECREAVLKILNRRSLETSEQEPDESLALQLRSDLAEAIAQSLEQQFPGQLKLQKMRRRQIDDLVVLVIESGLFDVVNSIIQVFDIGRRTYDNPSALSDYQITDGKLKLKITRKRSSKASSENDSDQSIEDSGDLDEADLDDAEALL